MTHSLESINCSNLNLGRSFRLFLVAVIDEVVVIVEAICDRNPSCELCAPVSDPIYICIFVVAERKRLYN